MRDGNEGAAGSVLCLLSKLRREAHTILPLRYPQQTFIRRSRSYCECVDLSLAIVKFTKTTGTLRGKPMRLAVPFCVTILMAVSCDLTNAAKAQTPTAGLLAIEGKLNSMCRGWSVNDPHTDEVCRRIFLRTINPTRRQLATISPC